MLVGQERGPTLVESLRHYWYPVARSEEVRPGPVRAEVLSTAVALWRDSAERLAAFYDLCIHRGTPLSLGRCDGDRIVCAYHGWSYGPDGKCVRIPSLPPERGIPAKARAESFRVQERYGFVWVCLGEPVAEVPTFPPEFEDPAWSWHPLDVNTFVVRANAARWIENLLDFSHFPWVHPGILGDQRHPMSQDYAVETTRDELRFEIERGGAVEPEGVREGASIRVSYRLVLPFNIFLHGYVPGTRGAEWTTFWVCCPVSTKETRFYRVNGRNEPLGSDDDGRTIFEQDRRIVEAQRPEELPLDLREELHLKGPDQAALAYRRALNRLGVNWE